MNDKRRGRSKLRSGTASKKETPVNGAVLYANPEIEGDFYDAHVRINAANKKSEIAYVHLNCALYSPEVYVNAQGNLCNAAQAILRGRKLSCTGCNSRGATVGCVVENCSKNFHLRCARESGGDFLGEVYTFYCKEHAEEKKAKPQTYCVCATESDDGSLTLTCTSCKGKYHPKCVNMSGRQAAKKSSGHWECSNCSSQKLV